MTDTTLVQRLRDVVHMTQGNGLSAMLDTANEAADEIDRLTAELVEITEKFEIERSLNLCGRELQEENETFRKELAEARKHLRRALEIACRSEASSDLDAARSLLASKGE